jgi:Natural resistance-associated macrophage protein
VPSISPADDAFVTKERLVLLADGAVGYSGAVMAEENTAVEGQRSTGWLRYLKAPGLVTGAADDDPSGVATYAQAGSLYRYDLLWTLLLCLPLLLCVQVIADRTALASGRSLGALEQATLASIFRAPRRLEVMPIG